MKERVSVTLNKETLEILNSLIKERKFRNKSHVIELAIELLNQTEENRKKEEGKKGK